MAKTAFSIVIKGDGPVEWAVPVGKYFVGKAFPSGVSPGNLALGLVNINGELICYMNVGAGVGGDGIGPLTANAGDIFRSGFDGTTGAGGTRYSLVGFIYDVS